MRIICYSYSDENAAKLHFPDNCLVLTGPLPPGTVQQLVQLYLVSSSSRGDELVGVAAFTPLRTLLLFELAPSLACLDHVHEQ